jgi:GcrA cell cycle regulator
MSDEYTWPQQAVDRLRTLWAEGVSAAEIGRRMGLSKHSVLGKIHRLNLASRPSPINRTPAPDKPRKPRTPPRAGLHTLPPLPSLAGTQ